MAKSKLKPAAAAAAARQKNKGMLPTSWVLHSAAVALAIIGTFMLTRSPSAETEPAPQAPRKQTADRAFPTHSASETCASWVADGECENNKALMERQCPRACDARWAAAAARQEEEADSGPPDNDPVNCPSWAAIGECEANSAFMLSECGASCRKANRVNDLHQDCAAWVGDGECFRNPAFMLQQCKASCAAFAKQHKGILQDTSDACVNFALSGKCEREAAKAAEECAASCHIQRICGNHSEAVQCQRALRCEALVDQDSDCAARATAGECERHAAAVLPRCLKSCSELDVGGLMRFHVPHRRAKLSPLIDLPGPVPRVGGFYSTPPGERPASLEARGLCAASPAGSFRARIGKRRAARRAASPWSRHHWSRWATEDGGPEYSASTALRGWTPRVPHGFWRAPAELAPGGGAAAGTHEVVVEHIAFSPRIRYLHAFLSPTECEHLIRLSTPLFGRSPVRGSVTRVRTSTTAFLGAPHSSDQVVARVRRRIARFSGYREGEIEPLQVVRYQQGQKYEGHHDFFDLCDVSDKQSSGRRQVTFLIYLVGMPEGETGGGTGFPDLGLVVAPEAGSAIVFNDCLDGGAEDARSLHQGLPPLQPSTVKMAINAWIRSHEIAGARGG